MTSPGIRNSVCIVTGASSGLGEQLARALAAAGATPVLAARRVQRLEALRAELPAADVIACDVVDADDRERLIATVLERHGRIDGLVNNAGISGTSGPALRTPVDEFARVLEINLVAPYALACAAARAMRTTGGGSIVNVASVMARHTSPHLPDAAYVASKAGLVGLTRELASQWGRYGIRVNALAPGFFRTEINAALTGADGEFPEFLTGQTPLGRGGRPGELNAAALFLLGPESSFVTGTVLAVDGGLGVR